MFKPWRDRKYITIWQLVAHACRDNHCLSLHVSEGSTLSSRDHSTDHISRRPCSCPRRWHHVWPHYFSSIFLQFISSSFLRFLNLLWTTLQLLTEVNISNKILNFRTEVYFLWYIIWNNISDKLKFSVSRVNELLLISCKCVLNIKKSIKY